MSERSALAATLLTSESSATVRMVVLLRSLASCAGLRRRGYMKYSLVADHYLYIALVSVCGVIAGIAWWCQRAFVYARPSVAVCTTAAVAGLTFVARGQAMIYRDPVTLFQVTSGRNPNCWLVENNFGYALSQAGDSDHAIEHYQAALKIDPDSFRSHNGLGVEFYKQNRLADAIVELNQGVKLQPNFPEIQYILGNALLRSGRFDDAIEHYRVAMRLQPDNLEALNNLGSAYSRSSRFSEAIDAYEHRHSFGSE